MTWPRDGRVQIIAMILAVSGLGMALDQSALAIAGFAGLGLLYLVLEQVVGDRE